MRKAMIASLSAVLLFTSWQAAAHSIVSPRDPASGLPSVVSPRDPASGLLLVLRGVFA